MARKVLTHTTACPDCGGDLAGDSGYCHNCGTSGDSRAAAPLADVRLRPGTDEDMPIRASHVFWFDGLLFTEWWYIPVSLLLMALVPVLLLSGILSLDYLSGILAVAVICVLALLLARKMR